MNISDIIRVWGTADNIELELKNNNGRWMCNLPPDLIDGQYAVQLFAMRGNGSIGMWTGTLYVANGIRCLHLKKEKYSLWLMPEQTKLSFMPERLKINLKEECCHYV